MGRIPRAIRLPEGACYINVVFSGPIVIDLEPLIDRMSSELSEAVLQVPLDVLCHGVQNAGYLLCTEITH